MLPEDLALFLSKFDEDDYYLKLQRVVFEEKDLYLTFKIHGTVWSSDEPISQLWSLRIFDVLHAQVAIDSTDDIQFIEDHPLLWNYTDDHCELYFGRKASNPEIVFTDIVDLTCKLYGDVAPSTDLVKNLLHLLRNVSSGLSLKAPFRLADKYFELLHAHGLNPSLIFIPSYSNKSSSTKMLKIGESVFLGSRFDFMLEDSEV